MRDETVITGIRNRDEDVMNQVITRYSGLLWPIIRAIIGQAGSEQDIEECVADTFIYLWQNPWAFDPRKGKLKSWLCIIARTRAIDRYRQLTRHAALPLDEAVLSSTPDLQESLIWEDTRQELLAAIRTLPEQEQQILLRRYYYRQKPQEIALALGLTLKQVNNHLYRAKLKLRSILTSTEGGRL